MISPQTFIRLEGIQLTSLTSDNVIPEPSDALYMIEPAARLSEDSGAAVSYRIVLGRQPTSDVSIDITGGDQIYVNGSSNPVTVTFTPDNWFKAQHVSVTAIDDLVIERDHVAPLEHKFTSSDERFNAITEDLSVVIGDNDFQRSVSESQTKLPSDGNNNIIYDLDWSANDQYRTGAYNTQNYGLKTRIDKYDLQVGSDLLEISSGLQSEIASRPIVFFGASGDDSILYANFADGGTGDDTLYASNVQSTMNHIAWHSRNQADTWLSDDYMNVLYGHEGNDTL